MSPPNPRLQRTPSAPLSRKPFGDRKDDVVSVLRKQTHESRGKTYELTLYQLDDGVRLVVSCDGKPVGPTYSVTWKTSVDLAWYTGRDGIDHLVACAMADIDRGVTV